MSNEDGGNPEIHLRNLRILKLKLPIMILNLKDQKMQAFAIIQMTFSSSKFEAATPITLSNTIHFNMNPQLRMK